MSRREDLDNAIWSDPDFEALTGRATLLYLWSFTNPRCGMGGIYKVSHRAMTESKVPLDAIQTVLAELADAGFAFYEENVLWVRSRVKHLRSKSPQMAKSVIGDLKQLRPDHPMRVRFMVEYGNASWLRDAFRTLPGPSDDPQPNLSENPIGKGDSNRVSGTSPEVPGQGTGQGLKSSVKGTAPSREPSRRADQSAPPPSLPDHLRPALDECVLVIQSIQAERGGDTVTVRAVGLAMGRFPNRDHLNVARELEHWALAGLGRERPVVDWGKTFATFLRRSSAGAPVRTLTAVPATRDFSIYDRAAGLGGAA